MRQTRRILAVAVVAAIPVAGSGQIPAEMTPETIRAAIAEGMKGPKSSEMKRVKGKGDCGGHERAFLSTPFSRVAWAAYEAKREGRTFTEAEVTDDLTAAEVTISVAPGAPQGHSAAYCLSATGLTLKVAGQDVPPISITKYQSTPYVRGATESLECTGVRAVFPLDVVVPQTEVVASYTSRAKLWNGQYECEGRFHFDPKKVR